MKTVGELFGSGQMQLPFVLQSAEAMKTRGGLPRAAHGEVRTRRQGPIVLATVKGDVHDIGKNLVDIILSNNGYDVVNLGIKQPIQTILDAAEEHRADAIGMSGLLVKSTVVMKENLEEMNSRGLAGRWPVLLGGAALTRAYVEEDLAELLPGRGPLRPRRLRGPAPDGRGRRGQARRRRRARCRRCARAGSRPRGPLDRGRPSRTSRSRSDVAVDNPVPDAAVLGRPRRQGHPPGRVRALPRRAGARSWASGASSPPAAATAPSYEELVETEGRPRLRMWLDRLQTEDLLEAAVVYGYFPAVSEGDGL